MRERAREKERERGREWEGEREKERKRERESEKERKNKKWYPIAFQTFLVSNFMYIAMPFFHYLELERLDEIIFQFNVNFCRLRKVLKNRIK